MLNNHCQRSFEIILLSLLMKKLKLKCGRRRDGFYSFKPSEEIKVLQDLLSRFINEEKYELAAIVHNRIEVLTDTHDSTVFTN